MHCGLYYLEAGGARSTRKIANLESTSGLASSLHTFFPALGSCFEFPALIFLNGEMLLGNISYFSSILLFV